MVDKAKVTLDDANKAMQDIVAQKAETPNEEQQKPAIEERPVEEAPVEEKPTEESEAAADDIDSLKKRLSDLESEKESRERDHQAKLDAMQSRFRSNEEILRDRYVKKSGVVEKALGVLRKAMSEEGVDPEEAKKAIRELEGSMNPASPSYTPPSPTPQATEDQVIIMNDFLNEMGMSAQDAKEFGEWLTRDAATVLTAVEQAVANRDLDGFLRIAHNHFANVTREKEQAAKRDTAVAAVKTVQRTQKEAARAASSAPTAPKKQPTGKPAEVDLKKLTRNDISDLLRQTVQSR